MGKRLKAENAVFINGIATESVIGKHVTGRTKPLGTHITMVKNDHFAPLEILAQKVTTLLPNGMSKLRKTSLFA
jgi:hypothetical protein